MKQIILVLIFFSNTLIAQQINTSKQLFVDNELIFNDDFIKLYKIKNISTSNFIKQDGRPLIAGYNYYKWKFDRLGRVISNSKTIPNMYSNSIDTILYVMRYDSDGNITNRISRVGNKIVSAHYTYEDNILTKSITTEQVSKGTNPDNASIEDTYSYKALSDSMKLKSTFNKDGMKYREELIKYDNENRILENDGRYLRGYIKTKEQYHYNTQGLLDIKISYVDIDKGLYKKYLLDYDNLGDINRIIEYNGEEMTRQIDFLYFENSIILEAIIDQDIATHDLNILKFDYEFYDNFDPFQE